MKSATSQGPVVAKVLTNAAGQVISVESLLAHQKQQGTIINLKVFIKKSYSKLNNLINF